MLAGVATNRTPQSFVQRSRWQLTPSISSRSGVRSSRLRPSPPIRGSHAAATRDQHDSPATTARRSAPITPKRTHQHARRRGTRALIERGQATVHPAINFVTNLFEPRETCPITTDLFLIPRPLPYDFTQSRVTKDIRPGYTVLFKGSKTHGPSSHRLSHSRSAGAPAGRPPALTASSRRRNFMSVIFFRIPSHTPAVVSHSLWIRVPSDEVPAPMAAGTALVSVSE